MDLANKVVVITGGSSGIGAEMGRMIAAKGGIPILIGRSADKLASVSDSIGSQHEVLRADVRDEKAMKDAVAALEQRYGRIDVLINNAGFGIFETFMDTPTERFDEMMSVNYMGIVRCTKAVLPGMLARGQGHIVNIASIAGKVGSAKSTGYSASKHAVLGFTNSLRLELIGTGVKVTAINPGPIDTPFFELADPTGNYAAGVKRHMLRSEQVAAAAVKAIERGKREVNMPSLFAFGAVLSHLLPRLFDVIAVKFLNKK